MAIRYLYNNETYASLYTLRQAVGKTERLIYGNPQTQEDFDKLPLKNKVTVQEYDPLDEMDIEVLRIQVMRNMKAAFNAYRTSTATSIESSLGFLVNANVDAFTNVDGCIAQLEQGAAATVGEGKEPTMAFVDFNDTAHNLTVEQLKTIKSEIARNGTRAYTKKWQYREQINTADRQTLKGMTSFDFE